MLSERIWIAGPSETMTLKRYSAIRLLPDDIPYIREPEPCVWTCEQDSNWWRSACHPAFFEIDDELADLKSWKACPFCLGRIVIKEGES